MEIISLLCFIAVAIYAYITGLICKPNAVKFKGKWIRPPKKSIICSIIEAFVINGDYYANILCYDTGEVFTLEIDDETMAAIPDTVTPGNIEPLLDIIVYQEGTEKNPQYSLAEREIRFKPNLNIVYEQTNAEEDIDDAKEKMGFAYEVRIALLTFAFASVHSAPTASFLCSAIAFLISFRNIMPLRYTNLEKCGIIKASKGVDKVSKKEKTQKNATPPGYDNWTPNRKYIHELITRISSGEFRARKEPENVYYESDFEQEPILEPESESVKEQEQEAFYTVDELEAEAKAEQEIDISGSVEGGYDECALEREDETEMLEADSIDDIGITVPVSEPQPEEKTRTEPKHEPAATVVSESSIQMETSEPEKPKREKKPRSASGSNPKSKRGPKKKNSATTAALKDEVENAERSDIEQLTIE